MTKIQIIKDYPVSSFSAYITYNKTCTDGGTCGELENCISGFCKCLPYFEFDEESKFCVKCPDLGEFCTKCCYEGLKCVKNYCECPPEGGYFSMCHPQSGVFITASQIALSAALVMGIAALAMVIYRLCTKPRYLPARHRSSQRLSEFSNVRNSNFLRASLTSIQIRVLSRLRDRPPPYDSQINTRSISQRVERNSRMNNLPEAPPPYEGHRDTIDSHRPPPYTEVIVSPAGFLNPTYAETETSVTISRFSENSDGKLSKQEPAK